MCPALTQAIHQAEHAFDLPPPDSDQETEPDFDWDATLVLSDRTRAVLRLMLRTIDDLGSVGQPIWPASPAAALSAFWSGSGPPGCAAALVHTSPTQWGMTIRVHAAAEPLPLCGPWSSARTMCSAPWMAPVAFSETGAPLEPAHGLALSALLGLTAAANVMDLSTGVILIRVPSTQAVSALRHGSSQDPAMQDIILLLQAARLHLGAHRVLFLPVVSPDPAATLAPAQIVAARLDSSTPRLLDLVRQLSHSAQQTLTLDLFATTQNTACPRFFSLDPEPASEAPDAFLQPSWASSFCPWCQRTRPEFVLLFPPHRLVAAAIRRAEQDQAQGIAILPYACTAPWWLTALTASRTPGRKFRPFHRIRCSPHILHHGSYQPGSRLAVFHFDFWRGTDPRPRSCIHGTSIRSTDADHRRDARDLDLMHQAWSQPAHAPEMKD